MSALTKAKNLRDLRASGWVSRTVKAPRELSAHAQQGRRLFPGIVGYDDTVVPEINLGLIAGHDAFLGEGQAKPADALWSGFSMGIPYLDLPGVPSTKTLRVTSEGRRRGGRPGDSIGWWREKTYAERLAREVRRRDRRIDPAKLATGAACRPRTYAFRADPRMHRGIFAMNGTGARRAGQVGLFNILEERRAVAATRSDSTLTWRSVFGEPGNLQPQRQGHPAIEGPHRLGDPHYPRELGIEITRQERESPWTAAFSGRCPLL